ncbi:hypothetical protein [Acidithiobacillus sp.]|uniref:hypothetical protein n=1 Tax=Acidithiobacillus sp. TaxID=1872118 RepID=UPI003D0548E7
MWYAIAHIELPAPSIRVSRPATSGTGKKPVISSQPPKVTKGAVFEMPAGLPPFLKKLITVPVGDETSEFTAVQSLARQVGVPFTHKGPDYALMGTAVPFGKPVPAYEFLWYIGQSYVPGTLNINGSGAIAAHNQSTS